ncbi:MAG: ABC transporter permease [Planctomycetaceae bacterium]|nr:ABC transporter permease [Planctomycetaceae bacterium]
MFSFAPYVVKGLWRHGMRTFLTAGGAAVALFVFCFVGAVQEGLERLTSGGDADRTLIVFQENRFCPTSSRLPQDYADTIRKVPGVKDVMPVQVWTNNCRASLDIVVFNGASPAQLRKNRGLMLTAGDWSTFESRHDSALIGANLARRRRLAVGDTFSIGDLSTQVAGVFESPVAAEENLAYTSLEFLQYTRGLDAAGLVTMHEAYLDENADPDTVAKAIDETLAAGPVATTTRRKGAFQASTLSDLVDLIGFAHWLGYACVGLVLTLVATTTVMAVQDRVKEHAVLQTIGVRPGRVFRLVVSESLLICLAGGVVGTLVALAVLAWGGLAVGAEGVTIAFQPSVSLGLTGIVIAALTGLLAGIIPAWHASRTNIVLALNQA